MTNNIESEVEKIAETLIDLGVEIDTHRDGDAFIRTFTFNDAQLDALLASLTEQHHREKEAIVRELLERMGKTTWGNYDPTKVVIEIATNHNIHYE